ncbi:uncharacterized protein LOC133317568 [Gastrolobium bilobum]|uniref:uncharacterized protein LOC133317568 n=1 Tax=Gastrolobium bilobum TaxID=150636 RepID=UPI002AB17386|nr:uncharacterized protein LOC133317568 [Gastrolobium bilobum]
MTNPIPQIPNETLNPNTTEHQQQCQEQEAPPPTLHSNPQSPKTLTVPDSDPDSAYPNEGEDTLMEDPIEIQHVDDPEPDATTASAAVRRGPKRKKMGAKRFAQERKSREKLQVLVETLKPIPFVPAKALDFESHKSLLQRLGLWDFVHVEFDSSIRGDLLAQLIASYVPSSRCSYVNGVRINVNRADLGRALKLPVKKVPAVVLIGEAGEEELGLGESVAFVSELVSNWMLLHDDTYIMPNEVLGYLNLIKEGHLEKVDWAGLIWNMLEKELKTPQLVNCYYASQLQCMIKTQHRELLEEAQKVEVEEGDEVKDEGEETEVKDEGEETEVKDEGEEAEVKDEGEDAEVKDEGEDAEVKDEGEDAEVKHEGEEAEVKDEGEDAEVKHEGDEAEVKDGVDGVELKNEAEVKDEGDEVEMKEEGDGVEVKDEELDDEEEEEEEDEEGVGDKVDGNGDVRMGGVDESRVLELEEHNIELSLGQDNVERVEVEKDHGGEQMMDFEQTKEEEPGMWLLDQKNSVGEPFLRACHSIDVKGMDCGQLKEDEGEEGEEQEDEDEDAEEDEHEGGFHLSPKCIPLEGMPSGTGSLIQAMEAAQMPFSSGIDLRDNSVGDFLSSRDDAQMISGSSLFGNGHKRDHGLDNSLNGSNKRVRSESPWNSKPVDFEMCMEQIEHWMEKARMMYAAKDQACEESRMNQQLFLNELQKRDNVIEHFHKAKMEDGHKREVEVYRFEKELFMMTSLVDGYRKALKETQKAFAEYRARCPQADEPLYKDVPGSGGLVLSVMELEKERLKKEEEERAKLREFLSDFEKKSRDIEGAWFGKLEGHLSRVESLGNRLLAFEDQVKHLNEVNAKRKVSGPAECTPTSEGKTA